MAIFQWVEGYRTSQSLVITPIQQIPIPEEGSPDSEEVEEEEKSLIHRSRSCPTAIASPLQYRDEYEGLDPSSSTYHSSDYPFGTPSLPSGSHKQDQGAEPGSFTSINEPSNHSNSSSLSQLIFQPPYLPHSLPYSLTPPPSNSLYSTPQVSTNQPSSSAVD